MHFLLSILPFKFNLIPKNKSEWKEKKIIEDDEESDTVTFDMVNTFVFRPDLTEATEVGLTGNEIVTIPHLLLMGGLIATQREQEPLLGTVIEGMFELLKPKMPFLTGRLMDILFDGVLIDCSSPESFGAKAICSQLRGEKNVRVHNDTHLAFSIFGGANGTSMAKFKVYRGIKDIMKLGEVVEVNDEEETDVWFDDEDEEDDDGNVIKARKYHCNKYLGTDSTIFAPFHHQSDILYAFAPDLCRSLGASYLHKSSYNGVPTGYYGMSFGDVKSNERQHCFCRDRDADKCPPKGTMDLFPCTKAPLIASKPQFLDADEKLVNDVDGLKPNRTEHDIFLHLEMLSSTPLSAAKRLQFSMDIEPVRKVDMMSKLRPVILPLMWVEESAHLNTTYTGMFKALYTYFAINSVIKYICLLCGIAGLGLVTFRLNNKNNSEPQPIQRVVLPTKVDAEQPKVESINSERGETEKQTDENEEEKVTAIVKERY
ncbi:hypothetical protein PVAND_013150 [Polypedilum vanderplanki]|uniref:Sensory neuron membrane protein 1 n=1 Tax=Polypedilum vanderplanki TaxID=319348 RepID=A0A9J6CNL5_POLVA|nr:hypothetical protein PVAND_013150 [Polypedilum vanderplanki]